MPILTDFLILQTLVSTDCMLGARHTKVIENVVSVMHHDLWMADPPG